jgi:hypothetical protein
LIEKLLPGLGDSFPFIALFGRRGLIPASEIHLQDEYSSFFKFGFGIAGSQEAIVSDFDETRGEHME